MQISRDEVSFCHASALDPTGRIFFWKGDLYRGVHPRYEPVVREVFDSGCLGELIQRGIFPPSEITAYRVEGEDFSLVIRHERLPYVVYPYEWTFEMFRVAALLVLEVIEICAKYDFDIHDGNPYNVLFKGSRPMYVDLGSFRRRPKRAGSNKLKRWGFDRGYEFLADFWRPLYLWSRGDTFLPLRILTSVMHSMPDVSWMLYKYSFLRWCGPKLAEATVKRLEWWLRRAGRLVGHGRALSWLSPDLASRLPVIFIAQNTALLKRKIERLNPPLPDTWDDYYCESAWKGYYTQKTWDEYRAKHMRDGKLNLTPRFARILDIIRTLDAESMVDLAGNQGVLAQLVAENTTIKRIVSTDMSTSAVNQFFQRMRQMPELQQTHVMQCARLNFMMPEASARAAQPSTRWKSDLVTAMAVTHHLLLTQHFHLKEVIDTIAAFTRRYAAVEFMPLGLWQGEDNPSPTIPSWYTTAWFQQGFTERFDLIAVEELEKNRILFVGRLKA